jgi:hypothetical protein
MRLAAVRTKLARAGRRSRFRQRKSVVSPGFGQIKQARGFRQFTMRGLEKGQGEWSLICTVQCLLKLAKAMKTDECLAGEAISRLVHKTWLKNIM